MKNPINVLFLCTHNSARSVLAEAALNHLGGQRFRAYSAGSTPRVSGQPNPLAIQTLQAAGLETSALRSKSWDEFLGTAAPELHLVITVCGNASEVCPIFPGTPPKVHWGYEDPSAGDAPDQEKLVAFEQTFKQISKRIEAFVALSDQDLLPEAIARSAQRLGDL